MKYRPKVFKVVPFFNSPTVLSICKQLLERLVESDAMNPLELQLRKRTTIRDIIVVCLIVVNLIVQHVINTITMKQRNELS